MLQGIIELQKKGVYQSVVIKKRRYWPACVKDDNIVMFIKDKEVGLYNVLLGELDGVSFHLVCIKEENCVMNLMSTYSTVKKVKTAHCTMEKKDPEMNKTSSPLT